MFKLPVMVLFFRHHKNSFLIAKYCTEIVVLELNLLFVF